LRLTNRWRRAGAPKIRAGAWRITIAAFWSRERHLDVRLPIGDIDAPVSAVLDGLQECGALDDDVRFVELVTYKALDRESPRTVITIEAVDEGREQLGLL
jgi:Holliday junction resolvase RusA-like endonuclease